MAVQHGGLRGGGTAPSVKTRSKLIEPQQFLLSGDLYNNKNTFYVLYVKYFLLLNLINSLELHELLGLFFLLYVARPSELQEYLLR